MRKMRGRYRRRERGSRALCIVLCIVCALSRNELASCSGSEALRTAALTLPLGAPFYSNPTSQSGRAASMGEGHLGLAAWPHATGTD